MKSQLKRIKAGLLPLLDAKASESYALWGTVAVKLIAKFFPSVMGVLDGFAGFISNGKVDGDMFLSGTITYVILRVVSKGAKAEV